MELKEFEQLGEGEVERIHTFRGNTKWFGKPIRSYTAYFEDTTIDEVGDEVPLFGINVRTKSVECMLNFATIVSQLQDGMGGVTLDKTSISKIQKLLLQDFNVSQTEFNKLSVEGLINLISFVVKISTPY